MTHLAWTTERPTVPGWYWLKTNCYCKGYLVQVELRTRHREDPPLLYAGNRGFIGNYLDGKDDEWLRDARWLKASGPPPDSPDFPSQAEAMALAVLSGDMAAACALADWLTEHVARGDQ